jgi:hypothetical protein
MKTLKFIITDQKTEQNVLVWCEQGKQATRFSVKVRLWLHPLRIHTDMYFGLGVFFM